MKAMIFAAGRGTRMSSLKGISMPKVLLPVHGQPLLVHLLSRFKKAGIQNIVINFSSYSTSIPEVIGDGSAFGVSITYSEEKEPLETGGALLKALPLLGEDPFIAVSGDLWTDYPFEQLPSTLEGLAHLVLNDTLPSQKGDFSLCGHRLNNYGISLLNFAGIGVYHPNLVRAHAPGVFKIAPLLQEAALEGAVTGEYYSGLWFNIGTPDTYFKALGRIPNIPLSFSQNPV